MAACDVVAKGSQQQPRERELAQALGEGFDVGHGDLRVRRREGQIDVELAAARGLVQYHLTHVNGENLP